MFGYKPNSVIWDEMANPPKNPNGETMERKIEMSSTFAHPYGASSVTDPTKELRDEIAKIAFDHLAAGLDAKHLGDCLDSKVKVITRMHAKLAFDFAEAFMRERYERDSVLAAMMQPNLGNGPLNNLSKTIS